MANKRLYSVVRIIMEDNRVISNNADIVTDESQAREACRVFAERCNAGVSTYMGGTSLYGKYKHKDLTDDSIKDHDTKTWFTEYESHDIDEYDMEESEREYLVEVRVTKEFRVTAAVFSDSGDNAEDLARESILDGAYDDEMNPDNAYETDIDVEDVNES